MPLEKSKTEEPSLAIRPALRFWTRRFTRSFLVSVGIIAIGLASLFASGNLLLPFRSSLVLEGETASKGAIFSDDKVRQLLMKEHIRVRVTQMGSREMATHDLSSYDFAFPSGQPSADKIINKLSSEGRKPRISRPFTSPLVLATFRQFAETLVANRVATRHASEADKPLYYTLDTAKFLGLFNEQKTWNDLRIGQYADGPDGMTSNGNLVLAHTPSPCLSNSGETFVALAAFVLNGGKVAPNEAQAQTVATRIKPMIDAQGMREPELFKYYVTPEGKGTAPIVVGYEHQYLDYQLKYTADNGAPDTDRVLLYPQQQMPTDPRFIAITPRADDLVEELETNVNLRRRLMELGYRIIDSEGVTDSGQLRRHLNDHGVPAPDRSTDSTTARMPSSSVLEQMVGLVEECAGP